MDRAVRREGRVLAMQALCQWDVQKDASPASLNDFLRAGEAGDESIRYASETVRAYWSRSEHVDGLIEAASPKWSLERISPVERNVMRVALTEMTGGHVPVRVAINEAVEIAGEYGSAESPKFVNGILDEIYKRHLEDLG